MAEYRTLSCLLIKGFVPFKGGLLFGRGGGARMKKIPAWHVPNYRRVEDTSRAPFPVRISSHFFIL